MAGKNGKRFRSQKAKVQDKFYGIKEACEAVVATASTKFDETVEIAIKLGVDPRKGDQNVRGSVPLPHGLGKKIRVAVFTSGEKVKQAEEAGADFVGGEDLAEKVKGGFLDFDAVIASPDMMVQIGKIGKILGPKGLMPSPKTGTVTPDVAAAVKAVKAGKADFRVDKAGIVHAAVGKASFGGQKIFENVSELLAGINKAKPATSKGVYLLTGSMSLTMGPAVKLDLAPVRNA